VSWSSRVPGPCPGFFGFQARVLEFSGSRPVSWSSRVPGPCLGVLGLQARVLEFLGSRPVSWSSWVPGPCLGVLGFQARVLEPDCTFVDLPRVGLGPAFPPPDCSLADLASCRPRSGSFAAGLQICPVWASVRLFRRRIALWLILPRVGLGPALSPPDY
jgi:hypothetical protein